MTIRQVIDSCQRDLGGFVVRRVLPASDRQMVGPFIFFDHLGPTQFRPGTGIDVRPHPHVALATVTYLFSGSLMHRDSLGSVQEIRPGDVNWMSAGLGIAHSERTPAVARVTGERVHGIQSWVALPDGQEDGEPSFVHYAAASLPQYESSGIILNVIAGEIFGQRSAVATLWPTLYVHGQLAQGAKLEVPADYGERAVYVAEGELAIGESRLTVGQMAVLEPSATPMLHALSPTRAMLLGGEPFPTRRYIWWNFVASSTERIECAKERWARQDFPAVPGESEFIPLPNY